MTYPKLLIPILTLLFTSKIKCQNPYDYLIFPDTTNRISIVMSDNGDKSDFMTGRKMENNSLLAQKIVNELNFPFHQSVIRLNQCSRNFSSNNKGPNVLFISQNEGGFPRHGLLLKDGNTLSEYPELNYVDLVVQESKFETGGINIYSHELGHVMMNNIWRNFPDHKCRKQHVSMGVTDYFVAFTEGWGIHFQRLAFDKVPLYQSGFYKIFDYDKTQKTWHSTIDEILRINAVVENRYIYEKELPQNVDYDTISTEDRILLEHTSNIYDYSKIKNAQQILSSEGVLATIFYRINTNRNIQNSYQENSFYNRFLLNPIPDGITPEKIFTPFENVFLKNFWVWNKIKDKDFNKHQIMIEFIEEWCNSFPMDKKEILSLFILTTIGKTINNDLGKIYEKMSWFGSIGDYQQYKIYGTKYGEEFIKLRDKLMLDLELLEGNIGPELWIENSGINVPTVLWSKEDKTLLYININTASAIELATFWDMDLSKANMFIKKRNEIGFFKSFEEATQFGFNFNGYNE